MLKVENLSISFKSDYGLIHAIKDFSFELKENKTLCIVGESGSGKSVTSLAIMGLLAKTAVINSGKIIYNNEDLLKLQEKKLRNIRGKEIAMIFQEPMTSLNPVLTIGYQLEEVLKEHEPNLNKKDRIEKIINILNKVGIKEPEKRLKDYPFKLSGGQRQRVMIAMAVICKPKLLIADEPTTALDVSIQAQVLELMKELQNEYKMSILFITHDLGVVNTIADDILVVYKGVALESGSCQVVLNNPKHPYTQALLGANPINKIPKSRLSFVDENIDYLKFKKELR
ncbi:ABC transporter ATP-binding protein [Campylobacter sp. MG1]|uniref:ABC transporter ATP-binding protein n=1 Tax=Campylobacter sp. MG1 TaxID=2976332 RepID=UPI00226D1E3D|nr:ABC transporter ATP-binding protein [Campylobacter sp. MG1]